jgi:hypothetical protein
MEWNETECLAYGYNNGRQKFERETSLRAVWLLVLVVAKLRDGTGSAVEAIVHGDRFGMPVITCWSWRQGREAA